MEEKEPRNLEARVVEELWKLKSGKIVWESIRENNSELGAKIFTK